MRPTRSGERELAFSSHYLWPVLVALPVLPSFYAAFHGRRLHFGSVEWFLVIAVGAAFLAVSLLLFLFRESLVLDLEGEPPFGFRHARRLLAIEARPCIQVDARHAICGEAGPFLDFGGVQRRASGALHDFGRLAFPLNAV